MRCSLRPLVLLVSSIAAMGASGRSQTHRQVAVTVDDLPYVTGSDCDPQEVLSVTESLLKPLREAKVPALGLVVGARCSNLSQKQRARLLQMWLDAGAELGNHTWSHSDLNRVTLEAYEHDILVMDDELHRTIPSITIRYFRAPYLHDGATPEVKMGLQTFLQQHGYTEAPVTIDNNDWVFATAYSRALQEKNNQLADEVRKAYIAYMDSVVAYFEKRSREVLGRECPQTLLIHASKLNAKMLPQLLQALKRRGYEFVKIDDAMRDNCYSIPDGYIGPKGLSWIHRWGVTKGKDIEMEPDEPEWIDRLGKQPAPSHEMASFRRSADEEATWLKDPQVTLEKLRDLYGRFDDTEHKMANDVLAEWVLSEDEGLRFDALVLIDEFRVCTAITALDNLAARLSFSTSPGAPYEVAKVQRIIARLNDRRE